MPYPISLTLILPTLKPHNSEHRFHTLNKNWSRNEQDSQILRATSIANTQDEVAHSRSSIFLHDQEKCQVMLTL